LKDQLAAPALMSCRVPRRQTRIRRVTGSVRARNPASARSPNSRAARGRRDMSHQRLPGAERQSRRGPRARARTGIELEVLNFTHQCAGHETPFFADRTKEHDRTAGHSNPPGLGAYSASAAPGPRHPEKCGSTTRNASVALTFPGRPHDEFGRVGRFSFDSSNSSAVEFSPRANGAYARRRLSTIMSAHPAPSRIVQSNGHPPVAVTRKQCFRKNGAD